MGRLWKNVKNLRFIESDVFIETGTFMAESLRFAASMNFQKILSCDVCQDYVDKAKENFKEDSRVHILCGSSHRLLNSMIDPYKKTTFWLDAHWQNNHVSEIDEEATECPLMKELKVIFETKWIKAPLILIDDASWFLFHNKNRQQPRKGYRIHQWPTYDDIKNSAPPGFNVNIKNDVIWMQPIALL